MGGTQSLHTNGYDEALALPTEQSAKLALRTQQIIAHESGIADTVDPLGGSYYIEALTDALEAQSREYLAKVDELGGAARAIDYFQDEIHRSSYQHQLEVESGQRPIVGVNILREEEERVTMERTDYSSLEKRQRAKLAQFKAQRDPAALQNALDQIRDVATDETRNMLPILVSAVKVGATLGEISDVLRGQWGAFSR